MVQTIAYGEELSLVHPPRPADPKIAWEQIWTVKVRVKSTGMVPLGMGDGDADAGRNRGRVQSRQHWRLRFARGRYPGGYRVPRGSAAPEPASARLATD